MKKLIINKVFIQHLIFTYITPEARRHINEYSFIILYVIEIIITI